MNSIYEDELLMESELSKKNVETRMIMELKEQLKRKSSKKKKSLIISNVGRNFQRRWHNI